MHRSYLSILLLSDLRIKEAATRISQINRYAKEKTMATPELRQRRDDRLKELIGKYRKRLEMMRKLLKKVEKAKNVKLDGGNKT